MIVVDTSVWSRAFRRPKKGQNAHPAVVMLEDLIKQDAELRVPGIVLQELLSGVRHQAQFERLREAMRGYAVEIATLDSHVRAAEIFNSCRRAGIAASAIDCLIAAITQLADAKLLAVDGDYKLIATVTELPLVDWAS